MGLDAIWHIVELLLALSFTGSNVYLQTRHSATDVSPEFTYSWFAPPTVGPIPKKKNATSEG